MWPHVGKRKKEVDSQRAEGLESRCVWRAGRGALPSSWMARTNGEVGRGKAQKAESEKAVTCSEGRAGGTHGPAPSRQEIKPPGRFWFQMGEGEPRRLRLVQDPASGGPDVVDRRSPDGRGKREV